ncbi:MAG: alpha/beta fold hydrolase [Myxococcota bacterium]
MSILLLHGFTGHRDDLLPLEIALEQAGHTCHRPNLPGHGTVPADMQGIRAVDWIASARSFDADVIIGLSMGALIGVILAAERPKAKLILLSPAFILQPFGRMGVWAAKQGLLKYFPTFKKYAGSDIEDPIARAASKAYPVVPSHSLPEFDALRMRAIKALPEVSCPIYTFFGAHDHTVDIKASSLFVNRPVILPRSAHILPVDYDHKELIKQCLQILEK